MGVSIGDNSLNFLFEPKSVAIIGASDNENRIGGRPLRYLREANFKGPIYPVNSKRETVQGFKAYKEIGSIEGEVDVAIIAVPAASVAKAIAECGKHGVKALVIFSAGFAEIGEAGAIAQVELRTAARTAGMRILGPNCLGVFNSRHGFFATFTAALNNQLPTSGSLAIASQSGAVGAHLAYLCASRGIEVSHWVTTGNEADIDVSEALAFLVDSPEVKTIIIYIEAVRNGDTFIAALEAARKKRKPVIVLKVGRSKVGAGAAASHTGALAGEDAIYDAILRQYGAARAQSIEQALDFAYACERGAIPFDRSIGLVTSSGGVGIQMADGAERAALEVSPLPHGAQVEIKALAPYASAINPIDTTGQVVNDPSLLERCIEITVEQGGYATVMVFLASGPATPEVCDWLISMCRRLRASYPDRLMVLCMTAPSEVVRLFEDAGYVVFEDVDRALLAVGALANFCDSFDRISESPVDLAANNLEGLPAQFNEHTAKLILANAGIEGWPEKVVKTPSEVGVEAGVFDCPVAIKIVSPDILHKSDVGGVILSVPPAEAYDAAEQLLARVCAARPTARIDGFLVSPMCVGGVETICGTTRDPIFGPMVMFGLGGILVEMLKDVSFRRAPVSTTEALSMIDEIRGRKLLDGVRGAPAVDVPALANVIVKLSEFAYQNRAQIVEIELNPVRVRESGAVALDAIIKRG